MTSKPDPKVVREEPSALHELLSVVIVVGMLGLLAYGFIRDQFSMHHIETVRIIDVRTMKDSHTDLCGLPTKDGRPTVVSMLYSDDKEDWIEDAAEMFAKLCPNIQVKLTVMGDIESADAILAGDQEPTLWSPADDLVVRYLEARWNKEKPNTKLIFDVEEQTSIAASPMVVLIWKNRVQVMNRILEYRPMEHGPWVDIACVNVPILPKLDGMVISDMVPGTWIDWYNPLMPGPPPAPAPAPVRAAKPLKDKKVPENLQAVYRAPFPTLEQIKSWGRVKIAHTSPTRSAAGLEALYLMAYDYVLPPAERPEAAKKARKEARSDPAFRGRVFASDLDKPEFQRAFSEEKNNFANWLRRCENGLESTPESARLLTDAFSDLGETRYDAVVTYEHLVFEMFDRIDAYAGTVATMEIFYPYPTIMNQHPVVPIDTGKLTATQKLAARKWIDYLLSVNVQKKAIEYGLRPVLKEISIRDYQTETNPFLKYRRYGVEFDVAVVEPPRLDGEAIFDMVRIWQDATGRN